MFQIVDIIIGIVNIYFHFQLLTILASIAAKYQPDGYELDEKLLRYRTLQAVMLTALIIIGYFVKWLESVGMLASVCMLIVYLIAGILLMKALFGLRRCISSDNDNDESEGTDGLAQRDN